MSNYISKKNIDSAKNGNCKLYYGGSEVVVNTKMSVGGVVSLIPDSGYSLISASFTDIDGFPQKFIVANNIGTYILGKYDEFQEYNFNIVNKKTSSSHDFVSEKLLSQTNSNHLNIYINDIAAVLNSTIKIGDSVKLVPDDGWQLISCTFSDDDNFGVAFTIVEGVGTLIISKYQHLSTADLQIVVSQLTTKVTQFNKVYAPTNSEMVSINNTRFIQIREGVVEDYGKYILQLIEVPFTIPDDYIISSENVILGNKSLEVKSKRINSQIIKIDLGSIKIPDDNKNSLDYFGKQFILYLPNAESTILEANEIVGYDVNLSVNIDVYTGVCTYNIKSSKYGEVIKSVVVNIGMKVPYSNNLNFNIENSSIEIGGVNDIKTPFIAIVENDSVLPYGIFTVPIVEEGNLNNIKGFITIENGILEVESDLNIKYKIMEILKTGVIIK